MPVTETDAVNRGEVLGMAQAPEEEAGHSETDTRRRQK